MVTWPVARAILLTAVLCMSAWVLIGRHNDRHREPPAPPLRDMDPEHPDWDVTLTFAQEKALAAIEGQFEDGGQQ